MAGTAFALNEDMAALETLNKPELRDRWTQIYGNPPPRRMGHDLLMRAAAYHAQVKARGGPRPALQSQLDRLARKLREQGDIAVATIPPVKPGTRLIREWQGETHEVMVLEDGFVWKGEAYSSLSRIARDITGTRWSGPAFFGLKDRGGSGRGRNGAGKTHG